MKTKLIFIAICCLLSAVSELAFAQATAFTYQGRLKDGTNPANGRYDFQFYLRDAGSDGNPISPTNNAGAVGVTNGLFTVLLDFGNQFPGNDRWLEMGVRTNGATSFVTLAPRQKLTPTPYAIFASTASNVSGIISAANLSGTYGNAVTFNNSGNSFTGNGSGLTGVNAATLGGLGSSKFWQVGGNAGTSDDFIGTVDDTTFNIRVNNVRVMRYRLATDAGGFFTNAPNVIGGSPVNSALTTIVGATISGGGGNESADGTSLANKATADFDTIGGGEQNSTSDLWATVGGGKINSAGGSSSTVCGGEQNSANGAWGTIGGGAINSAGGQYATVPGGLQNSASATESFAAGFRAKADNTGSFVWADSSNFDFHSTTANQFRVRAVGGTTFVTAIDGSGNATAGVHVLSGDTAWSSISDRNAKKNFQPLSGEAVLEKLAAIPVEKWNYKWESDTNTPHIGPMAQDFKGAFYPGRDDKSISTLEFDGVELAAIQGLNEKMETRSHDDEINIRKLEAENAELKQRLATLEKIVFNQKSN
jgi:Chaperone of endosialidase